MELLNKLIVWFLDFCTDVWGWIGAIIGIVLSWWTAAPALGQAVLIAQTGEMQ